MTDADRALLRRAGIAVPIREDPGAVIAAFTVPGRAVPWTPPRVSEGRHAFKDRRLVAWQKKVKDHAAMAMIGRRAYTFPVKLVLTFSLNPGGNPPDLSNLTKGLEDSLQEVVIANDRQVCSIQSDRVFGPLQLVWIGVYASEDS